MSGIFTWKQWQGPMSQPRGVSDILGILPDGRFLAIEVKTRTGRVSEYQASFLYEITKNGGVAFVARSVEDVIEHPEIGKYLKQLRFA